MKKKMVIFDFDGTIWNSIKEVELNNLEKFKEEYRSEISISELYTHNVNIFFDLEKNKLTEKRVLDEAGIIKAEANYTERKSKTLPWSGIKELFEELKEKEIYLALLSLTKSINTEPLLIEYDFKKYFVDIVFGDNEQGKISKVESFDYILKKNNLVAEDVVFVTDTLGDVREANVVGIETIAVTYGQHTRAFFERENNQNLIAIVDSVEEMREKLLSVLN